MGATRAAVAAKQARYIIRLGVLGAAAGVRRLWEVTSEALEPPSRGARSGFLVLIRRQAALLILVSSPPPPLRFRSAADTAVFCATDGARQMRPRVFGQATGLPAVDFISRLFR